MNDWALLSSIKGKLGPSKGREGGVGVYKDRSREGVMR